MRKYLVEITSIEPNYYNISDLKFFKVYCCTSFFNPNFYGKKLYSVFDFLDIYFNEVLVITPGYLYRHNFKMIEMCSDDVALELPLAEEKKYIENELAHCHFFNSNRFKLISWSELYFSNEYKASYNAIQNFYTNNVTFSTSVNDFANHYLKTSKYLHSFTTNKNCLYNFFESSVEFLLEEIAMFQTLIGKGYEVSVYPGKMIEILDKISQEKFNSAPMLLKSRISIELKLKRVGRKRQSDILTPLNISIS